MTLINSGFLLLISFLFAVWTRAAENAPCYLPNGEQAPGFFPCDPTAYITNCCPTGWTCYSNSMCVVTDPSTANSSQPIGTSIRGSCTNPEWNNAVCGDYCLTDQDIGGSLKACGDDRFCCADDPSCSCANGAFQLNPGRVQTIIGVEGLEHTETSTIPVSTSTVHTTSSTTSSTTLATTTRSSTSSLQASSSAVAASAAPAPKPIDKPGVKAGVAIGVILGVLLLAVGAWLLFRCLKKRHDRRRSGVEVQQTSAPLAPAPSQDPYVRGNAASVGLDTSTATSRRSPEVFDHGDAPMGNEYERNIPSPVQFVHPSSVNGIPPMGGGPIGGGYNGSRAPDIRPLSFVSDDDEEARYVRPQKPNELGI